MFLFKKKTEGEEERRCELCEYARILPQGGVYCEKKKKERGEEEECSSFVLDLLKKKPMPAPVLKGLDIDNL